MGGELEIADLGDALLDEGVGPIVQAARAIGHAHHGLGPRGDECTGVEAVRHVCRALEAAAGDLEQKAVVDRLGRGKGEVDHGPARLVVGVPETVLAVEGHPVGVEPEQPLATLVQGEPDVDASRAQGTGSGRDSIF